MLSRKNEYDADNYASEQVDSEYLVTSLIKLYKSNLNISDTKQVLCDVLLLSPNSS